MLTVSASATDNDADAVAVPVFDVKLQKLSVDDRRITVGLGAAEDFDIERARIAAGAVCSRAAEMDAKTLFWDLPEGLDPSGFVEGTLMATYKVARWKSGEDDDDGIEAVLVNADADAVETARILGEAVNVCRDLQNAPPNEMTPTALATHARNLAAELGLSVDVLGREQMRAAGMGAFSAVAQGAREEPQLITLRYAGAGATGPTLGFVGKAVTFDTGGISLKAGLKMSDMKFDMSGGAAVLAAVEAIARLQLPVDVLAVVGATDNDIGSGAYKPGDILRSRSGTTIEVLNTDAEGRLVLCDCLTHAIDQGAERLVDVATLTGAIITTFGTLYAGLMGTDDAWCDAVLAAGAAAGEPLWRLPLHEAYADELKGTYGDIVNVVEDRRAGSIVAAEFLRKFVGDVPWVHLDIAGTAWNRGRSYAAKGGSGFAVRTLVEVARAGAA